jgi:hypothetical protein
MKLFSRRTLATTFTLSALLGLGLAVPMAHAQKRTKTVGLEAWRGQRVLLLLPLELGEGFNVDRAFGQALLPDAEQSLQALLQATGKFSVMEPHRFNPVLQRAQVERAITATEFTTLVTAPTLENARLVLSKLSFDRPPMIAQFFVEEIRLSGTPAKTSVQAQVSGRLYELGNPVALKTTVITSNSVTGRNVTTSTLVAMTDAFRRSTAEFVAPIEEIQLALPEPVVPTPTPVAPPVVAPPVVAPPVVAPPVSGGNNVTLPGDVSILGSSSRGVLTNGVPQLPSATPPLGINVPNAPTTQR